MNDPILWFITVEVLGLAALPLVGAAFAHLPDRGWSLAKPLALLLTGTAIWLPPMLFPALPYSRGWIFVVLMLFVAANATVVVMQPQHGLRWLAWLRAHWGYAALCEALFAGGMWVLASLRALNPGAEGTEKFMDQAFLASLMRATHLPPPDPWLAGYPINYYYFGHFLLANLAKLLDTPAPVAFNLGIALIAGLTATGIFGVAANMTAAVLAARRRAGTSPIDPALSPGERAQGGLNRAIPFALFAVVAALVLGNLRSFAIWWANIGQMATTSHQSPISVALHWLAHPALWANYDYWNPTRAIPNTITEFPDFSFLLADLHAHVLALPFTVLAIGVALHLWLSPPRRGVALFGTGWGALPTLVVSGLSIGALYLINGWDLPTYLALALLVLVAHQWNAYGRVLSADFVGGVAGAAAALVALCFIPYLPFYATYISPSQGIGIVPGMANHQALPLSAGSVAAGLHPESRTAIVDEIGANGLMLFLLGAWLVNMATRRLAAVLHTLPAFARHIPAPESVGPVLHAEHPRGPLNDSYLAFSMATTNLGMVARRGEGSPTLTIDASTGEIAIPAVAPARPDAREPEPEAPPPVSAYAQRMAALVVGGALVALGALTALTSAWDGWTCIWGLLFLAVALWLAVTPLTPRAPADAESAANSFPLLLIAFGGGLIALCEVVFLRDVFVGQAPRMNTVFKAYFQVWTLFALASAPALAWLLMRLRVGVPGHSAASRPPAWLGRGLVGLVLVALVAASLIYPLGASHALYPIGQKTQTPSLNGLTDNTALDPGDIAAISWLSTHAAPDSVLVEGIDPQNAEYSLIYGRVSVYTGIPTIIGWSGHEYQWRVHWLDNPQNAADYNARLGDLHTIYTSLDPATVLALLEHYHVRYVYVGATEWQLYGNTHNLNDFGRFLTPIYAANGVTIYQVPGI